MWIISEGFYTLTCHCDMKTSKQTDDREAHPAIIILVLDNSPHSRWAQRNFTGIFAGAQILNVWQKLCELFNFHLQHRHQTYTLKHKNRDVNAETKYIYIYFFFSNSKTIQIITMLTKQSVQKARENDT